MPKSNAVWGIDIGNSALKALRCRPGDQPDEIVAEAFDFIEYPKILSEPGAEPAELVADALKQFLKRNTIKGIPVVMSVPGQTGLARFIKLPPVQTKKIPDIVAFEARQQIPFALEDVVWDYQQMPGSTVEEGFALEAEVGLFAMKRDQIDRAIQPLTRAGVEVESVQLAPLALYNFLVFDQMQDLPPEDEFIPDAPPPSVVILSMGTDATDLVVTNGFRVWQRSIPLGGNQFTKALTKELKLTFAKAEHLKRNATAAEDPKAVFQAMRPEFNNLLTEIQRSLGYFTTVDRAASINYIVGLGNAMKLPGLQRYLAQNLGHEVKPLKAFRGLKGDEVVEAPVFKENHLSFATAYGLVLQGLERAPISTNLLPEEIVRERMIKAKKPWAVAAIAVLLAALSFGFVSYTRALATVGEDVFGPPMQQLESTTTWAKGLQAQGNEAKTEYSSIIKIGTNLTSNVEGRVRWLELLCAINACLPTDPPGEPMPEELSARNLLYVVSIEAKQVSDLQAWFTYVKDNRWYVSLETEEAASGDLEEESAEEGVEEGGVPEGPSGPGYVVQISGYHFHNLSEMDDNYVHGAQFVRETLVAALHDTMVDLPERENGQDQIVTVSLAELGIGYPALLESGLPIPKILRDPNAKGVPTGQMGYSDSYDDSGEYDDSYDDSEDYMEEDYMEDDYMEDDYGDEGGYTRTITVRRSAVDEEEPDPEIKAIQQNFKVQFAWQPTLPSQRKGNREAAAAEAKAAAEANAADDES